MFTDENRNTANRPIVKDTIGQKVDRAADETARSMERAADNTARKIEHRETLGEKLEDIGTRARNTMEKITHAAADTYEHVKEDLREIGRKSDESADETAAEQRRRDAFEHTTTTTTKTSPGIPRVFDSFDRDPHIRGADGRDGFTAATPLDTGDEQYKRDSLMDWVTGNNQKEK